MLYKYLVTAALTFSTVCGFAYQKPATDAPLETSTAGFINYGNERLEHLKSNGRVTLTGTQVTGPVEVNGSLLAQDAAMGPLTANGHVYLENSKVQGPINAIGFFSADKSDLQGNLTVKAYKITLRDTTCGPITIQKVMWPFNSQVVELVGKSVCNGDIHFESGQGRVVIRDASNLKGAVHGGELEQEIILHKK